MVAPAFNSTYLLALVLLLLPLRRLVPDRLPLRAFWVFVVGAGGLASWHVVEHGVILSNVIKNGGCPCPGIGDAARGATDTVLHLVYNAITYLAILTPFWYITRTRAAFGLAAAEAGERLPTGAGAG